MMGKINSDKEGIRIGKRQCQNKNFENLHSKKMLQLSPLYLYSRQGQGSVAIKCRLLAVSAHEDEY